MQSMTEDVTVLGYDIPKDRETGESFQRKDGSFVEWVEYRTTNDPEGGKRRALLPPGLTERPEPGEVVALKLYTPLAPTAQLTRDGRAFVIFKEKPARVQEFVRRNGKPGS